MKWLCIVDSNSIWYIGLIYEPLIIIIWGEGSFPHKPIFFVAFLMKITDGRIQGKEISGLMHAIWSVHLSPISSCLPYQSENLQNLYLWKENSWIFEGVLKVGNILDQGIQRLIGWIYDIILFYRAQYYS